MVARSSTGQSEAKTDSEPAARNAVASPLNGGECNDMLEPVLQADNITISDCNLN